MYNDTTGYFQKDTTITIGKDKTIVSRELKQNADKRNNKYDTDLAQHKYEQRLKDNLKHIHFTSEVKLFVDD